jgi:SAM-dependent methyltransferase/GT2 family glycosyltransferase
MSLDVAVILPCLSPGQPVRASFESVQAQTFPAAEIVLVRCAGTNDESFRQSSQGDVKVIHCERPGPGAARNAAVMASQGELIVVLEATHILDVHYLERVVKLFTEEPDVALLISWNTGFQDADHRSPPTACDLPTLLDCADRVHACAAFRRSIWAAVGGFDEALGEHESYDFWLRMLEGGHLVRALTEPASRRREEAFGDGLPSEGFSASPMTAITDEHASRIGVDPTARLLVRERTLDRLRAKHRSLADRVTMTERQTAEMNERVAEVVQALRPLGRSRFEWGHFRRLSPISPEWGADRGRRIDCYYIEQFLQSNAHDITGAVLEVHDDDYTARFGGSRVTRSDVVDIDETNRRATVFADLRRADAIPSHTYDCFIMTQTLHVIDDMRRVLVETARILKPGGILLATLPCASRIAPKQGLDGDFWRFTAAAARRLFAEFYPAENLIVTSHGNVLVTIAYLYGLACEELRPEEFEVHDPYFPLIVSVRAKNAGGREEGSVVPDWRREPHILT